jgi:hypothetical protein
MPVHSSNGNGAGRAQSKRDFAHQPTNKETPLVRS